MLESCGKISAAAIFQVKGISSRIFRLDLCIATEKMCRLFEKKNQTNKPETLALRTGSLGWLGLVEVGRTASWPEHPSDCPVLTPPAPLYLEPTAPASQKQSREPVPWGYSCILTSLQATRLGRAAGSRTATCSSQSSRLQACSREDELVRPCSEDL